MVKMLLCSLGQSFEDTNDLNDKKKKLNKINRYVRAESIAVTKSTLIDLLMKNM